MKLKFTLRLALVLTGIALTGISVALAAPPVDDALTLQIGGPQCTYLLTTRQSPAAFPSPNDGPLSFLH